MNAREKWNDKYRRGIHHDNPDVRLIMYQGRLAPGRALDVAGGLGENAAILALAGWKVVMAEISDEAVKRARERAKELKVEVEVVQADAAHLPFGADFDLVVCTYFLDRTIDLTKFLKPGGTLFFETFIRKEGMPEEYLLKPGERLFPALEELLYTEEADGDALISTFIGRKCGP